MQEPVSPYGGEQWHYSPAMQFFARMINAALIECKCALAIAPVSHGVLVALPLRYGVAVGPKMFPTDEALLARDWIARSESISTLPAVRNDFRAPLYLSFPECCAHLGVDVERTRVALLAAIDDVADFDNDLADARLDVLTAADLPEDKQPLFNCSRAVPVRDQLSMF